MNWYVSLLLQVGFTKRGMEARLPEWLAGGTLPLACEYLRLGHGQQSSSFNNLWRCLCEYRRGNRSEKQVRQTLDASPWILPDWQDEMVRLALERRHLDAEYANRDFEEADEDRLAFLSAPRFLWDQPRPRFASRIIQLADFPLDEPDYSLTINKLEVARLLKQPDGGYSASCNEVTYPSLRSEQIAEIVSRSGETIAEQRVQLYQDDEEIGVFDMKDGFAVDVTRCLDGTHEYGLLVNHDLEINVSPKREDVESFPNKKVVWLSAIGDGSIRIELEGDLFEELSAGLMPPPPDTSGVMLSWGALSSGPTDWENPQRMVLHLPNGWDFRRAHKHIAPVFFEADAEMPRTWSSEPQSLTDDDRINGVCVNLLLCFQNRSVRLKKRLQVPGTGVFWRPLGESKFMLLQAKSPLPVWHARHADFLIKLNLPDAGKYRECVLLEGGRFHRRLRSRPTNMGELNGVGESLMVCPGLYNAKERIIVVSEQVIDTGLVKSFHGGETPHFSLFQDIDPTDEHVAQFVSSDCSLQAFPVSVMTGSDGYCLALPPAVSELKWIAAGLFFRGKRLGSVWHNEEVVGMLQRGDGVPVGTLAKLCRVFECPLMLKDYRDPLRLLFANHLTEFADAYVWAGDVSIWEIDNVKFAVPCDDESSRHIVSAFIGLKAQTDLPLDTVDALVARHEGADPLAQLENTLREWFPFSPVLASAIVRKWTEGHAQTPLERQGALKRLADDILDGECEDEHLRKIVAEAECADTFVKSLLESRDRPHWKGNVNALLKVPSFRILFTRALLLGRI